MSEHTPAPWLIAGEDKCFVYALGPQGTNAFWANVQAAGPERIEYSEKVANALLIAAAPDLLKALRDMLSGWRYIHQSHGDLYGVGWDRAQDKAEAVILKATGEPA